MKKYEEIVKDLERSKKYYQGKLNALEAVAYKTKKDGTPFKVLNLNLENATVYQDWSECMLKCNNPKTYDHVDRIRLWSNTENDTLTIEEKLTLIKKKLSEEIECTTKNVLSTEQRLSEVAKVYDEVLEKLKDIQNKYGEWFYKLDLQDCEVKYNDYSDNRIKKEQEAKEREEIIKKLKENLDMGTREKKILDKATKIVSDWSRDGKVIEVLYTIYDCDNNSMQVQKSYEGFGLTKKPTYTIVG